jgi:hypothetical protein
MENNERVSYTIYPKKDEDKENMTEEKEPTNQDLCEMMSKEAKRTFTNIILYNALVKDDINEAIDQILAIHEGLLAYHGFIAGFTFLGVSDAPDEVNLVIEIAYFLLAISFIFGTAGGIISFLATEYYHGIKGETPNMIVHGVMKWGWFFFLSQLLAVLATGIFAAGVMVAVHDILRPELAFTVNAVGALVAIPICCMQPIIILKKQVYESKVQGLEGKPIGRQMNREFTHNFN